MLRVRLLRIRLEVPKSLNFQYGEIDEINVCENIGEHMVGNVYVKFMREEDADKALEDLNNNRWSVGLRVKHEIDGFILHDQIELLVVSGFSKITR